MSNEPELSVVRVQAESRDQVAEVFKLIADVSWTAVPHAPVNPAKTVAAIIEVAQHDLAFLFYEDDEPFATLGLVAGDLWYADEGILEGLWCSVRPEKQSPRHQRFMIQHVKELMRGMTITRAAIVNQTGDRGRIIFIDAAED